MPTDQATPLGDLAREHDPVGLALVHWRSAAGTARLADPVADLPLIQRRILSGLLRTEADELSALHASTLAVRSA